MRFYNALSLVLVILSFGFLISGQVFGWNVDSAATGAVIAVLMSVTGYYYGKMQTK